MTIDKIFPQKNKRDIFFECIYYLYLFFAGFILVIMNTVINYQPVAKQVLVIIYVLGILLACKIALEWKDHWSNKDIILALVCCAVLIPGAVNYGNKWILMYVMAILGAKRIDYRRILGIILGIVLSFVVVLFVLSNIGIIGNITTYRHDGAMPRYGMGFGYATFFSAYITAIIAIWAYLRNEALRFLEAVVMLILCVGAFILTNARINFLSTILIVFFVFIYILLKNNSVFKKLVNNKMINYMLCALFFILAILSVILGILYNGDSDLWCRLSALSSGRIGANSVALTRYPITLFGNEITLHCDVFDGMDELPPYYFIINNSYVEELTIVGLLSFIGLIIGWTYISVQESKRKDIIRLVILASYSLLFFLEQRMLNLMINPFFILLLADFENKDNEINLKTDKKRKIDNLILFIKNSPVVKNIMTLMILCILVEVIIFNVDAMLESAGFAIDGEEFELQCAELIYDENNDTFRFEQQPVFYIYNKNNYKELNSLVLDVPVHTLGKLDEYRLVNGLKYNVDLYLYENEEFVYYKTHTIVVGKPSTYYIDLDITDGTPVIAARLNFEKQYQITINSIVFNAPKPIDFNVMRFSIMFGFTVCVALIYIRINKSKGDSNKTSK